MFWDSFRRWETLWRSLDIASRVYTLCPDGTEGVEGLLALGASLGLSAALGAYLVDSAAFGWSWAFGASTFGASFAADLGEPAGFAPSGSTSNKGFPTPKVSPSFGCNLVTSPATGLLISTVTLSVSMLATV